MGSRTTIERRSKIAHKSSENAIVTLRGHRYDRFRPLLTSPTVVITHDACFGVHHTGSMIERQGDNLDVIIPCSMEPRAKAVELNYTINAVVHQPPDLIVIRAVYHSPGPKGLIAQQESQVVDVMHELIEQEASFVFPCF